MFNVIIVYVLEKSRVFENSLVSGERQISWLCMVGGYVILHTSRLHILRHPEVTANIYCKSSNLPNTDTQNHSTDLR